jgi:hypothetical protein
MAYSEGSYIRWQALAIEQLGYAVGLILAFAGASIGFGLALVKDQSYIPTCWSKAFVLAGLSSLLLSLGLGVWCVINRLRDFRETRGIARDREELEKQKVPESEIEARLALRRSETNKLGKRSWGLFWWQIGTFAFGVMSLIVAFGFAYQSKLF